MSDFEIIQEEALKIAKSGALGRSRAYSRLLEYLVECSVDGRRPKEIEIAADVFDKGADFDSNQDSLVRVYVHNLRQKLENHYASESRSDGLRLAIPKGEYRLTVVPAAQEADESPARRVPPVWVAALAGLLVLNLIALFVLRQESPIPADVQEVAQSEVWASLLDDELPLLVVVGDYFIFAELDEFGTVSRLVREFDINSSDDLDDLFLYEPDLLATYMDLDLTYLPQGSAFALKDLLRVIYTADKPVRVTPMSELRVADLKSHHIVYVGYISALGTLMDFVFAASGLRVGESYDELLNLSTGEYYTSGAGIPGERSYQDYGLISSFPGPEGNHFLVVAGTRDSGVMHSAQAIASSGDVAALESALEIQPGVPPAFEALYEVNGFDRMNLDAMLIYTSSLDYSEIWGGELSVP